MNATLDTRTAKLAAAETATVATLTTALTATLATQPAPTTLDNYATTLDQARLHTAIAAARHTFLLHVAHVAHLAHLAPHVHTLAVEVYIEVHDDDETDTPDLYDVTLVAADEHDQDAVTAAGLGAFPGAIRDETGALTRAWGPEFNITDGPDAGMIDVAQVLAHIDALPQGQDAP